MRKVDIPAFRAEVVATINANRGKITSLEGEDNYSIFTFCGKNYACEITIDSHWIGYDFDAEVPEDWVSCNFNDSIDLNTLEGGKNEERAIEIYDDLLDLVKGLFEGRVYYKANKHYSYTAILQKDGTYRVAHFKRKRFLFWRYMSGWPNRTYSEAEFQKLGLQVVD